MKKTSLAAALLAATGAASAQVQVYGLVDTGVVIETKSRVNPANPNNVPGNTGTTVRMPSLTAGTPSRLGFRGKEDLGGGMSAFFNLEAQIGMDDGSLQAPAGRLFSRAANVGLSSGGHTLTFGRQFNMTAYSLFDSMIIGPGLHSIASLNGYLGTPRSDNAIAYMGRFDGFTFGATYSFGRDAATNTPNVPSATNCGGEVAGNREACRQITALVKYDAPTWGVALSFDQLHGNTGAFDPNQPFGGPGNGILGSLGASNQKTELRILNGYYVWDKTRFGAGWVDRETTSNAVYETDQYWIGVRHDLSPNVRLFGQYSWLNTSANMDADARLAILRGEYSLSKRTYLYASYAHIDNRGTFARSNASASFATVNGSKQNSLLLGISHSF